MSDLSNLVDAVSCVHVVGEGDTLVLRTPLLLSKHACENLSAAARRAFPGMRVVILEEGVSLEVVRDDQQTRPQADPKR